jgi:hypothetical protein
MRAPTTPPPPQARGCASATLALITSPSCALIARTTSCDARCVIYPRRFTIENLKFFDYDERARCLVQDIRRTMPGNGSRCECTERCGMTS